MESKFLASLAEESFLKALAIIDMSADGSVPTAGGNIFLHGALLEVEASLTVEDVQMNNGMERHGTAMAIAARGLPYDLPGFVNKGEQFLLFFYGVLEIDHYGEENEKMRPQVGLGAASNMY